MRSVTRARPAGRPLLVVLALAMQSGCTSSPPNEAAPAHRPRTREVTVTTVPLLVKEQQRMLPFLEKDFARGGVLDGKEVYAFSPSSITVVAGDTIRFTFINPEDDVHSFVLPDLSVSLPPQAITSATYVARRAGVFPFVCAVPSHLPMMSGQLVVLAPGAVADVDTARRVATPSR